MSLVESGPTYVSVTLSTGKVLKTERQPFDLLSNDTSVQNAFHGLVTQHFGTFAANVATNSNCTFTLYDGPGRFSVSVALNNNKVTACVDDDGEQSRHVGELNDSFKEAVNALMESVNSQKLIEFAKKLIELAKSAGPNVGVLTEAETNYTTFMEFHVPITEDEPASSNVLAVYKDCMQTLSDPDNIKRGFGTWSDNMIYIINRLREDPYGAKTYTHILVRNSQAPLNETDGIKYYANNCVSFAQ